MHDDNKLADIWFWRWLDTLWFRMPREVLIPKTTWKKGINKNNPKKQLKIKTTSQKNTEKQNQKKQLKNRNAMIFFHKIIS